MNRTEINNKVKDILKGKTMNELLELWAMTAKGHSKEIFTVRGWLMDEFYRRNPEGFDAWIDSLSPDDETLKDYIL